MKLLATLVLIGVTSAPAFAGGPATGYRSRGGYAEQEKCYKREYREEYIPGTMNNPGYVRRYNNKVRVPCERPQYMPQSSPHSFPRYEDSYPQMGRHDDNSCIEGSVLGGILGGGAGAALSRGDGRWWAIPLGIVGGSMVGCQVDGG